MPCYSPLKGYKSIEVTKNGKRKLVFSSKLGYVDMPLEVPCGNCLGCRIDRSRQWAIRCEHEMQLHTHNCFITLTYAPEHLPEGGTLVVKHFQDFMKRLRRRLSNPSDKFFVSTDFKLRFFHCGEYGEKLGRPHYHAIIFGYDFPDKKFFQNRGNNVLYRSDFLEELWPYGHSTIGSATWQSAAYVARYIMKKVTGDAAEDHYRVCDSNTGEIFVKKPEYVTMSRRPGIGKNWFDEYGVGDVYPKGEVITRAGKKMKPPKYYDTQYEILYPDDMERIRIERKRLASLRKADNTPERLDVRRKVHEAKLSRLKREL